MRLKNYQRDRIVNGLVHRAMLESENALASDEDKLALAVYRSRMPETTEKAADKLNQQMPGMIYTCRSVNVKLTTGSWFTLYMNFERPQPRSGNFEDTCPEDLFEQVEALKERKREIQDTRNAVHRDARAVVYSCNTVEQLKAAWPEVMPIVEEVMGTAVEKKRGLPAIDRSKLNAMFKLPVDAKEAA